MLNERQQMSLSKLMSKILRHSPQDFGLSLDEGDGSCAIEDLLNILRKEARWSALGLEDIEQIVRNCEKQRFEITGGRIRARYGHSHDKLSYPMAEPPTVLYHGTNNKAAPVILEEGIRPMKRQYVHLSAGLHFATLAGKRRGELVILAVDTVKAVSWGVSFYYAGNEVWLADGIPSECCSIFDNSSGG
ncbi:RNA 2'-phosphotransferase [Paenibacillus radicis (ex Xue et al. 2023)]|uniref:Probable RNA 2'-phosphotransferase n=1 Tax=Paenibacillus radicis (ex Xue et al. 2023) TaxID=2972489 RepID=A0ABT1YTT6_9BACL|nr:RNA 2'-phosphotransferase [Paenibacillus radicis (ex Xue et al. 2023)]MCR8636602.1 RNA 2'-phosphotransferase [Paenibacillus radicis (ex Xue et al. 2023)]